jgi:hypothetical protein
MRFFIFSSESIPVLGKMDHGCITTALPSPTLMLSMNPSKPNPQREPRSNF